MLPKRIPGAIWHPISQWPTGPFTDSRNLKVVWHTTQGSGAGALSWYRTSGGIPHATLMEDGTVRQHYELDQYSRALLNKPGGVQTNLDGAIQFEIAGFAGRKVTAAQRATLRKTSAWLTEHGIVPDFPLGRPSGGSDRKATFSQWDNGKGHFGHSQVPENDHTDPNFTDGTWAAIQNGFEDGRIEQLIAIPMTEWRTRYNKATPSEFNSVVELVQRVIGATPDGLRGPQTDMKFAAWTLAHGGNSTNLASVAEWAALLRELGPDAPDPRSEQLEGQVRDLQAQLLQSGIKLDAANKVIDQVRQAIS